MNRRHRLGGRKPVEDKILHRLRSLCARALDESGSEAERSTSAMILCRELRKAGFLDEARRLADFVPSAASAGAVGVSVEHGRVHLRREVIVPQTSGARRWVDFDPPKGR